MQTEQQVDTGNSVVVPAVNSVRKKPPKLPSICKILKRRMQVTDKWRPAFWYRGRNTSTDMSIPLRSLLNTPRIATTKDGSLVIMDFDKYEIELIQRSVTKETVNSRDRFGRSPLILAVMYGHSDAVISILLAGGADVNARDRKGQTALMIAKERGHEDVAALLRQHGAKV